MKIVKTKLIVLAAQKALDEGQRVSLRRVAAETGIPRVTIYNLANNTMKELPTEALVKLCDYFNCGLCDLLTLDEVPG
jgi:DNA-binding Xre family transcriptional regulator